MKKFTFAVGDEQQDSYFLQTGMSEYRELKGVLFRRCFQAFGLRLPPAKAGKTRVTLRLFFQDNTLSLKILAGGRVIANVRPKPGAWRDVEVVVNTASLPLREGLFDLRGELSGDPYFPPCGESGKVAHLVGLCRVTVAAERGDLAVPGWCLKPKIAAEPVGMRPIQAAARPMSKPDPGSLEIFFGDVHVHTDYSPCGKPHNGTMEDKLKIARDRGHDFIAFTDHGECLGIERWDEYCDRFEALAAKFTDIVILPAVEWTSRNHGHRNVYWLGKRPPAFSYHMFETNHPRKFAAFFKKHGLKAFVVPHHMPYEYQPGDIGSITPETEPLIEIYSGWGSSESHGAALGDVNKVMPGCTVQDALGRGLKLGFMGGSDAHNAAPGDDALTGVIAEKLTRDTLFEALRNRLCYATSSVPILLDFSVNCFPMGSVLAVNQYNSDKFFPIRIRAEAVGTAPLERLEIIANGAVIATQLGRLEKNRMVLEFSLDRLATRTRVNTYRQHVNGHDRYYYARVTQSDGHRAWSSPIFVDYRPDWE